MYYTTDEILEQSAEVSLPVMALVAYKNGNSEYYIESHMIDEKGRLLEGTPLSRECITELVSSFSLDWGRTPSGKIPGNLLYADNRAGHERYVWYNPPGRRMMYFTKGLNLENELYHVPGVLYAVTGTTLDIYAFKGKKPAGKLYQAPFFNVTGAAVCLGNARLEYPESPDYDDLLQYWEKRFWMTEFSHLGGHSNPTRSNLFTATKKWKSGFDYEELLPSGKTLNDLIR